MPKKSTETQIKSWFITEVKYIIGVVSICATVGVPYFSIRQDIALIKKDISIINSNHEVHIQDIVTELKKIKEDEITIEKNLAVTNQVLIDHLNNK
jgi:hypothetical protein